MPAEHQASKPSLRILQILPALVSGGVERGTLDLSRHLVAQGHKAWVCSSGGPMVASIQESGAEHIYLPVQSKNPWTIWQNSRRLIKLHQDYQFDVIHVRSRAPAWSVFLARKQLNCRLFSSYHGQYGFQNKLKRFYNRVMLNLDVCIAVSEFIQQHILANYPAFPSSLKLVRRGIDLQHFSEARVSPEAVLAVREKWHISEQAKVIILPGRLTRLKGHLIFLQAIRSLMDTEPQHTAALRCLIVGDEPGKDDYREELEQYIETHQMGHIVHLTGICHDMPVMYSLADIVVSASTKPEAFGRTACEAQAMGCLVIATKHGGSLETIAPEQRRFMCQQGNSDALAASISSALKILEPASAKELRDMQQSARRFIEESFSLERMCCETEQLYLEYTSATPQEREDH